jgi:hypothetical protein
LHQPYCFTERFRRIYTQHEDNKIYEFCWDSESLKWYQGNGGYPITSVARDNSNLAAFKVETDQIILACIGQDGRLWLKRLKVDNDGRGKAISNFSFDLD